MKESENDFCLGILYDTERLYLFQKKNGANVLRLNESYNLKDEESATKDLCLHLPDAYNEIPSFDDLRKKIMKTIDRTGRTIDDLDIVTGVHSKQLNDGVLKIVKVG